MIRKDYSVKYNSMKFTKIVLVLLFIAVVSGCGGVSTRQQVSNLSRAVSVPSDTALVSVSRERWTAPGITLSVYANGKYLGELGTSKVISWYHPVGELRLVLKDRQIFKLNRHVGEGRSYHYKFVSNSYVRRFNGGEILDLGSTKIAIQNNNRYNQHQLSGFEHTIAGGSATLTGFYVVQNDVNISGLQVRRVRERDHKCASGFQDHIELNGPINEDSALVVERMLEETTRCKTSDGSVYVTTVYMNSIGGNLEDGYKIGRVFKQHGVKAVVSWGQSCDSSCAIAFLGAKYRSVSGDGSLLFHTPYIDLGKGKINCIDRSVNIYMRRYLNEMLGGKDGSILYERIMKYCSSTNGWRINRDAAKIYNISSD